MLVEKFSQSNEIGSTTSTWSNQRGCHRTTELASGSPQVVQMDWGWYRSCSMIPTTRRSPLSGYYSISFAWLRAKFSQSGLQTVCLLVVRKCSAIIRAANTFLRRLIDICSFSPLTSSSVHAAAYVLYGILQTLVRRMTASRCWERVGCRAVETFCNMA